MHKFSAAVSQSSALTVLCFLALLDVLHEYVCGALGVPAWRVARLVIAALAPLRYENLCIMRALGLPDLGKGVANPLAGRATRSGRSIASMQ